MQLFDVHAHHPGKTAHGATNPALPPSTPIFACFSGFSPQTNGEVMDFALTHDNCVFSLGLAPQDVIRTGNPQALFSDFKAKVEDAMAHPVLSKKFAAIGECGLDYHWGKKEQERKLQRGIFEQVIEYAKQIRKPLVIHSRDAEEDCMEMLSGAGCKHVLMHCYGGDLKGALFAQGHGWLISIPPVPSKERKRIIKELDITSLVAESDAPYIGKTCHDAAKSVEMIAKHKGMETDGALRATNANAASFFKPG